MSSLQVYNNLIEREQFLAKARDLIDQRLDALVPSENEDLSYSSLFQAARYSLFSGGKRLRPLLVLAAAHTFGDNLEKALDPACALECIHTYSLIHDDLPCMDNDDIRRDKPTLHRVYPEWHALLTGDYLLTFAFEILSKCPLLTPEEKIELITLLAKRSGGHGMIGGQMLDLLLQKANSSSDVDIQQMLTKKTAALIATSLEFGAIIANAPAKDRDLLRTCGFQIGIAFQITDDLLDTSSSFGINSTQAESMRNTLLANATDALEALSKNPSLLQSLFKQLVQRTY